MTTRWTFEDHPRVCGEYGEYLDEHEPMMGSPPRVRGIPGVNQKAVLGQGITPACAGNTLDAGSLQIVGWDHPRVCGEYLTSDIRQS